MEHKSITVPFKVIETKDHQNNTFEFSGYASTFGNVDKGDDVVVKGAFTKSLEAIKEKGHKPPALWQHQCYEPVGVYIELKEDDKGLFVRGILPKTDTFVTGRVIPQMKIGSITQLSIGYRCKESDVIDGITYLKEIDFMEASLVTFPMNEEANILDMKSAVPYKDLPLAPREMDWDSTATIKRVKTFTKSEEKPSASYKNAFLWYDKENAENFGAYKLPYADVVDGKLKAVPRGIFAASGGRGVRQADIPDADKQKVIANINKYYAKMRKEFDDESLVSPFEKDKSINMEDFKSLKEIESYIKDFGVSNKEAKTLISKIKSFEHCDDAESKGESRDVTPDSEIKELNEMLEEFKQLITE